MTEFHTTPVEAPLTQDLRGHFIVPDAASEGLTDKVTARDVSRFREPFTHASEQSFAMEYHGSYIFQHGFTILNPFYGRMKTGPQRVPVNLSLETSLLGAKHESRPSLQMTTPISDQSLPGWAEVRVRRNEDTGRYGMAIREILNRHHLSVGDGTVQWGEPSRLNMQYSFYPGVDHEWHKAMLSTYALKNPWETTDAKGAQKKGFSMQVFERELPMTEDESARTAQMYEQFWDLLGRVEKIAADKPSSDYYVKRLGQIAASFSGLKKRSHLFDSRDAKWWRKTLSAAIVMPDWPITLDLSIPEHRELHEKLKPAPGPPEKGQRVFPEGINIDGVKGLDSFDWP